MSLSDFQRAVYKVARAIPPGRVISYGGVAALAGRPAAARAVGAVLRALPDEGRVDEIRENDGAGDDGPRGPAIATNDKEAARERPPVPWWRIIGWRGEISTPTVDRTARIQRALLEGEGVEFDEAGRISWARYGWNMEAREE